MKTEDLLRYECMYRAMRTALGTPWLTFEYSQAGVINAEYDTVDSARHRLAESEVSSTLQAPNEIDGDL